MLPLSAFLFTAAPTVLFEIGPVLELWPFMTPSSLTGTVDTARNKEGRDPEPGTRRRVRDRTDSEAREGERMLAKCGRARKSSLGTTLVRRAGAIYCLVLRRPGRAIQSDCVISLTDSKSYDLNQAITLAFPT